MSSYALIITTSPTDNKTSTSLEYAKALLSSGHSITGVFFYQHGVLNANAYVQTPSDELNLLNDWTGFATETSTPLHLCVSAGERRGLTDSNDAPFCHNIAKPFVISGLGELVVLTNSADKTVQL